MTTTPPGWYDDGHGALRWWDGAQWTEHVAEPDPEPAPGAEPDAASAESASTESASEPAADSAIAASEGETQVPPATGETQVIPATGETQVLPPELAADLDPAAAMSTGMPSPAETPGYAAYGTTGHPGSPTPFPGAYPGYPEQPAGAFTAATEPKKSKLWIVWVVLGVVLLGIVIAAAVLIPLMFLSLTSGGAQSGSAPVEVEEGTSITSEDEQAAVDAVALYDEAWQTADCDKYLASTTADFREIVQITDCDAFVEEAGLFGESVEDYTVTVTAVSTEGESVIIGTVETYQSMFDENGESTGALEDYEDHYQYVVVPADGGWAIDDAYFE